MSKLWIDATNILKWKVNPVGVVRVEAELIKYFLNKGVNFCYFKNKKGLFIKIDVETLKNTINTLQETKKTNRSVENHSFLGKSKKVLFNYLKRKLPNSSVNFIDKLSGKISKIYYHIVLLPLQFLKVTGFTRKKFFSNKMDTKQHCFDYGDYFLSAGLHWDSDCLIILRSLKKRHHLNVTTICYDLIPVLFPEFYLNKVKLLFEQYFKSLSLVSDKILCISENTKNDLNIWLKKKNLPIPKTEIVTLGSDFLNIEQSNEADESVNKVIKEKYLLYVSTIEIRKNHWVLVKAYEDLINSGVTNLPKLVFVGRIGWGVEDLLAYLKNNQKLSNYIIHLNNVTDAELIKLYDNSLFCLYPSQYEGWGLPIAEALDRGKFSLCAKNSSTPEAGRVFVEYLETNLVESWANKIKYYTHNCDEIEKKEKYIKQNYKSKSWRKFCKEIELIVYN